jgi:hypothetical protein
LHGISFAFVSAAAADAAVAAAPDGSDVLLLEVLGLLASMALKAAQDGIDTAEPTVPSQHVLPTVLASSSFSSPSWQEVRLEGGAGASAAAVTAAACAAGAAAGVFA